MYLFFFLTHLIIRIKSICGSCYCDDDCELSDGIKPDEKKTFIEIDDLMILSVYCGNMNALKILIENGGCLKKCRDDLTKDLYTLKDEKTNF